MKEAQTASIEERLKRIEAELQGIQKKQIAHYQALNRRLDSLITMLRERLSKAR